MTVSVRIALLIVAMSVALAATQGPGKVDPTLDRLSREFAGAMKAKDAARVARLYADDAVLMPPGMPLIKGRAAIQAHYEAQLKGGVVDVRLSPLEASISGDLAFDVGTEIVEIGGARGSTRETGKYIVLYKRVAGEWKVAYESSTVIALRSDLHQGCHGPHTFRYDTDARRNLPDYRNR